MPRSLDPFPMRLLPLVPVLLLCACTTTHTYDYIDLNAKNHESLATMVNHGVTPLGQLERLPWASADSLKFQEGDEVMKLEGGFTWVHLVALPADAGGRTLVIKSYPTFNKPTSVIVPVITFLDRDLKTIETDKDIDFRTVSSMTGDHLLGRVRVPAGADTILVGTDASHIGARHDFKTRPLFGTDPAERNAGPAYESRDPGIGSSYEGRVKLTLE